MYFMICVPFLQQVFHSVAYKAHCREDLLAGIDEFLMQVTYVVHFLSDGFTAVTLKVSGRV